MLGGEKSVGGEVKWDRKLVNIEEKIPEALETVLDEVMKTVNLIN